MPKVKKEDDQEMSERAKKMKRLNRAKQSQHSPGTPSRNASNCKTGVPSLTPDANLQLQSVKTQPLAPLSFGKFGWTNTEPPIPFFFSEDVKYVSSRIANDKVYSRFPKFSKDIYECMKVPSYPLTEAESQLLNEINFRHSDSFFGDILFRPILDVKITLEDFEQSNSFYLFCTRLLSDKELNQECCGFIRIDQLSYVPFIRRDSLILLPTFYFEGDNCDLTDKSLDLTKWEMSYLKILCQIQQIKKHFYSGATCRVMDLTVIKNLFSKGTVFEESWPNKLRAEWIQSLAKSNSSAMKTLRKQKSEETKTTVINKDKAPAQSQAVISNISNSNITLNIHRPLTIKSGTVNASNSHQSRRVMSISNVSNSNINITLQSTQSKLKDTNKNSSTKKNVAAYPNPAQNTKPSNFGIVYPLKTNKKNATKKAPDAILQNIEQNSNQVRKALDNATKPSQTPQIEKVTESTSVVTNNNQNIIEKITPNTPQTSTTNAVANTPAKTAQIVRAPLPNTLVQIDEKTFYSVHGTNFVEVNKVALTAEQRMLIRQYATANHSQPKIVQIVQRKSPRLITTGSTTQNDPPRLDSKMVQNKKANTPRPSTREPPLKLTNGNVQSVPEPYSVGTTFVFNIPFICINLVPHLSANKKSQAVLVSTTDLGMTFYPENFLDKLDSGLKLAGLKLYKLCDAQRAAFDRVRKVVGKDEMFVEADKYTSVFFKLRYYMCN